MPPVIFNVGFFLGKHYRGDIIGLFCVKIFTPMTTSIIFFLVSTEIVLGVTTLDFFFL